MRQAADAIDHLNFHKPSILHRDVKPEHILLTKNMQIKVGGFGLAKLVKGASATINWASVGLTLAYAAPELFKNTVTRWTDQYSLALTYYRLRAGISPFADGIGPLQMMQAHVAGALTFSGLEAKEQAVLKRACRRAAASAICFVRRIRRSAGGGGRRPADRSNDGCPGGERGCGAASRADAPRKRRTQSGRAVDSNYGPDPAKTVHRRAGPPSHRVPPAATAGGSSRGFRGLSHAPQPRRVRARRGARG